MRPALARAVAAALLLVTASACTPAATTSAGGVAPASSEGTASASTGGPVPSGADDSGTVPPVAGTASSTARTTASSAPEGPGGAPGAVGAFPDLHLPGVNDPSCRSPEPPVVLLHGTFSTVAGNFTRLAAALRDAGRCVYGVNYGLAGVAPVRDSAATVAGFVDSVLRSTGADQVDVVAFSQGGLVLRTALRMDGLAPKVRVAAMIAPTFHGTTSDLLTGVPGAACPACADQAAGSALLADLAAGGDLDGDVRYATISSRDDRVVTPTGSQSPVGPSDRVRSLVVQDVCPDVRLDHLDLPGDPGVISWILDALTADGRPDPSAYRCS